LNIFIARILPSHLFSCREHPAFVSTTKNPGKGLFNGTAAVQHSLILVPREDREVLFEAMSAAPPGKIMMLKFPPKYVKARLTESQLLTSGSLHRTEIIVPIPHWGSPRLEKIKSYEFPHHFPPIRSIQYR
jgi:hypothetical protein